MGLLKKMVRAGENSGYDPDLEIEIGFELWATMRSQIIGAPEPIEPVGDGRFELYPVFTVNGYGLYIAPSCPEPLRASALGRFGTNYLGCIH